MTAEVSQSSGSRTGKTGQVVGGGSSALGAIIGAIAGGGKGAAIGAVSGAAAGGAVQVLTNGERVKIPIRNKAYVHRSNNHCGYEIGSFSAGTFYRRRCPQCGPGHRVRRSAMWRLRGLSADAG